MKINELENAAQKIEKLERALHLKQLQINRLMDITLAINQNMSAEDLFGLYKGTLGWELKIGKMILFVQKEQQWEPVTHIGIEEKPELLLKDISPFLFQYTKPTLLNATKDEFLSEFELLIPVYHKQSPIALAFIGALNHADSLYENIKYITTITNIISVAIENKRLFKQQILQERLKYEMELAREVQAKLIPSQLPTTPHYELDGIYLPHYGVGGDYFDYIPFNDNEFAFCIADISGKGISAAILMSNFQANLQVLVRKRLEASHFIDLLNQAVINITKSERFITFFIGKYFVAERKLTYINAGHNPPILYQNNEFQLLTKGCTILGSFDKLPRIEVGEINIQPDALLLNFTDGLTDLKNDTNDTFDEEQVYQFIQQNHHLSVKEFNKNLLANINQFRQNQPFPDDITLLTCKIK
jgi:sigma-B regulation protein RsbU (phosphoserine phosphatase)